MTAFSICWHNFKQEPDPLEKRGDIVGPMSIEGETYVAATDQEIRQ